MAGCADLSFPGVYSCVSQALTGSCVRFVKESNNTPLKPDLTVTLLLRTVVMIVVVTAVVEEVVAAGALKIIVILEATVLLMLMTAMAGRII